MARRKRRKKVSPQKKLEATYKKIDAIFEKKKNKKLSVKSTKNKKHQSKGNSVKSYEKYKSQAKSLLNELGVNDLKDITSDKMNEYVDQEIKNFKNGDLQAPGRLNDRLSSLNSLQQGIQETNIIGKNAKQKINFGDIQNYRNMAKKNNVFRPKKSSTWMIPSNRQVRTLKDRLDKKSQKTNDPLDKIASNYVKYAQITGCRPTNGLAVRDQDITINKDGTAKVVHYKDKGSLTREMTIYNKDNVEFLRQLKERADRGKIFQAYKQDGTPMANESLVKRVRERVSQESDDIRNIKNVSVKNNNSQFQQEERVTLHSLRKNFVTNRSIEIYDYFLRNEKETHNRMKTLLNEMSYRNPKVGRKYKILVDKQNRRNKHKRAEMLSPEETALFLTSCESGHFRTDIIKESYLDKAAWNSVKNKYNG